MGDKMIPIPFRDMLERIVTEYTTDSTIFGIHKDQFFNKSSSFKASFFDQPCSTPVGPAAGPHTQLAQNILASYLSGGRFIELKTVQILDTLEIDKPCIDARDEGYNVEWSTEFTLEQAYDEYLKAWILIHVLETLFPSGYQGEPDYSCIFNMSVGYDLAGIKTERMQTFINNLINSDEHPLYAAYIQELVNFANDNSFLSDTPFEKTGPELAAAAAAIPGRITPSVTLSTMHGCPPDEIEAICTYMLTDKGIDTYVKLNPTLLGYDAVREALDGLGFTYTHLNRDSFDHDLQYADAAAMLKRLVSLAEEKGRGFGIKLSNTLGTVNDQGVLPGTEMYMSGRALFPLTIRLAARLSREFDGTLPISYSGGANASNIGKIFETGIKPITAATDLLKPGGYGRLGVMADICDNSGSDAWLMTKIDVGKLDLLAAETQKDPEYQKDKRGFDSVSVPGKLPIIDCYIAPCVQACPIHQDVPEYIHLTGTGRYAEALELIYEKNPLPNITGYICDHQCMYNCTRIDYEGPVDIREVKRIAAENGFEEYKSEVWEETDHAPVKAAVIGAGPAGLAAAFFLARSGFTVTVFEREEHAGGVVKNVIPEYRLPAAAIQADIDFTAAQGVEFIFNASSDDITIKKLRAEGYSYILYGVGAEKDNPLLLEGTGAEKRVIPALEFLGKYNRERESLNPGENVVVVGGGNTAMDGARSAMTLPGVKSVKVLYRRTKKEMPADLEEYDNAVKEGAEFLFLANPERIDQSGRLLCRKMKLGEPDESGRQRPVPTDEIFTIQADTIITAIGEHVDESLLEKVGIPLDGRGRASVNDETLETSIDGVYLIGDAQTGPSTIVRCIASARKASEAILDKELEQEGESEQNEDIDLESEDEHSHGEDHDHDHHDAIPAEDLMIAEDVFFAEVRSKKHSWKFPALHGTGDGEFAAHEASRCLECSYICNKCVEVCPNRANVAGERCY